MASSIARCVILSAAIVAAGSLSSAPPIRDAGAADLQRSGELTCRILKNKKRAQMVRISNGVNIGRPGPRENCFIAIGESREGVVCAPSRKRGYDVHRNIDNFTVGKRGTMTFEECTTVTSAAVNGSVCVKQRRGREEYDKYRISNLFRIASDLTLDECTAF